MKTATVSELRSLFSKYLAKVKTGEEVIVTDHGKAIAKIVSIPKNEMEIPLHLHRLEQAGLARIGKSKLPPGFWGLPRPKVRKGAALRSLLKERED